MKYLLAAVCMAAFSAVAAAQNVVYNTAISMEPTAFTKPPQMGQVKVEIPKTATQNGVEGTTRIHFTLGADGRVHDTTIIDDLPDGVGEAVRRGVENMPFTPAANNGKPVDMKGTFTYTISVIFDEFNRDVTKVQVLEKGVPEYPAAFRSTGKKGRVTLVVAFYPDGHVVIMHVESGMPAEFIDAAKKAALATKFQPAMHNVTKKAVTQSLWLDFDFKP